MKPLVGERRRQFFALLRLADRYLFRAEKIAFQSYGSHMLSRDISRARDVTRLGYYRSMRDIMPYMKMTVERITPPATPKVLRMTKGEVS